MSPETAIAVSHKAIELEKTLRRVIRGKDEVVRLALVSVFARGHLLIEGVPGVGIATERAGVGAVGGTASSRGETTGVFRPAVRQPIKPRVGGDADAGLAMFGTGALEHH